MPYLLQSNSTDTLAGPGPTTQALPSLLTPSAFIPSTTAYEIQIASYINIGCLAVVVWDILHTIGADYTLLTKHRIRFPTVVYFVSRLSTFGWLILIVVFGTAPIGINACFLLERAGMSLFAVTISTSSLLFFIRVKALYQRSKSVIRFFFLCWLGVVGSSIACTMGLSGTALGPTRYCISSVVPMTASLNALLVFVYDTLVFVTISWKLIDITMGESEKKTVRDFVQSLCLGSDMPHFSKALLQEGQAYYLSTVIFSLIAIITLHLDFIPLPLRGVFGIPDGMLMSVMACRVFRNTLLGVHREGPETLAHRAIEENRISAPETRPNVSQGDKQEAKIFPLNGAGGSNQEGNRYQTPSTASTLIGRDIESSGSMEASDSI